MGGTVVVVLRSSEPRFSVVVVVVVDNNTVRTVFGVFHVFSSFTVRFLIQMFLFLGSGLG